MAALNGHLLARVQKSAVLDHCAPFRARRTRVRWVARASEGDRQHADFTIGAEGVRTLSLEIPDRLTPVASELCSDLALHDWLLGAILQILDRSRIGALPRAEVVRRLAPAVDHLLHLWMPAARVEPSLLGVWESIERRPGFTRQWRASVDRVRDQVAVSTAALYSAVAELNVRSA